MVHRKDVFQQGDFTRIIFRQKKTKGQEYLDITQQAAELMGERGKNDDFVFTPDCTNKTIQNWVLRAGIDKKNIIPCGPTYLHHKCGSCSAHPLCTASIGISVAGSVTAQGHSPVSTSNKATLTDELPTSIPNVYIIPIFYISMTFDQFSESAFPFDRTKLYVRPGCVSTS